MAKSKGKKSAKGSAGKVAEGYTHPDQTLLMRPEVGTQAARKVDEVRRALDGS